VRGKWPRLLSHIVALGTLLGVITVYSLLGVIIAYRLAGRESWARPVPSIEVFLGVFLGVGILAIVIHELGHLLAARACGFRVTAIHIGSPPAWVTVKLGTVKVGLGAQIRGQVTYAGRGSSARRALVSAAGPLANLLVATALLPWVRQAWELTVTALFFAIGGLTNLVPCPTPSGQATDGLALWQSLRVALVPARRRAEADLFLLLDQPEWHRREDAADRLLAGYQCGVPEARRHLAQLAILLRQAERLDDLLQVHAVRIALPRAPQEGLVSAVHRAEWEVLTFPSIPKRAAHLAARRVLWALRHHSEPRAAVQHTLALARLREGRPRTVERLCASVLSTDLQPGARATVLATVALAQHALGQEPRPTLEAALALDPTADLVEEAASNIVQPRPSERGKRR
jgi:Zn-dependent protease